MRVTWISRRPPLLAVLATLVAALLIPAPAQATGADDTLVQSQVVNGRAGDPADFPWLVAIADREGYETSGLLDAQQCGGTAVTPRIIVTAAHCVVVNGRPVNPGSLVVAATPSGRLSDAEAQVVRLRRIAVNPDYNDRSEFGDLAVLHLRTPLDDIGTLLPALPGEDALLTVAGTPAQVAGWGATTASGRSFPDAFRFGDLVVFPRATCGRGGGYSLSGVEFFGWGRGEADPATMICAAGVRGNGSATSIVDSCIGDSGGPLIAGDDPSARLIGVVSYGPQRCASRVPGVYTRVSAFTAFLRAEGVPFAPTPSQAPRPPILTADSVTPTTATVLVRPNPEGPRPINFIVTAKDRDGRVSKCTAAADADRPVSCTITQMTTGRAADVTATAVINGVLSEPSVAITVKPAGKPDRPRITYAEATRGGVAVFGVERIRGNGSPITKRIVSCLATDAPKRTGKISAAGIATLTDLRRGASYSCRAKVANALGSARSTAVTLRTK